MIKHSIESRLCLLVTGLLFSLLLVVGHFQLSAQQSILMEDKADKYESISTMFAAAYRQVNEKQESRLYKDLSAKLMSADGDISYVLVTASDKKMRFVDIRNCTDAQNGKLKGRKAGDLAGAAHDLGIRISAEMKKVTIPIITSQGKRRTVIIGFSPLATSYESDILEARLLATFAAAFILGIIGSILLAKAILQPIKALIEAAHLAAAGDLNANVEILTNDEIGELGETFNVMMEAIRAGQEKLIQRANTDSLTELYNHRYFQERLAAELSRAARYKHPLSMVMLDVDHFKNLNDTYGHPFGDLVLQQIAKILVGESRDIDIVARYGGEEFALILPETKTKDALILAERLRSAIQHHPFIEPEGRSVPVTISLGLSQYPVHSLEREGLIMAADLAMYQSKTLGRNRVTAYSDDIQNDEGSDPYKLYLLLHAKDVGTIEAMAAAVDAKGHRTPGFSLQVMKHCVALAEELRLSEAEKGDVQIAGLLHDIGKLGVPEAILTKRGALTEEEVRLVRSHPALGYTIVQKSPHLQSMLPGILYHHERWNGSGYPNGLAGDAIPMIARLISVVDAFHAMTVDRPHKQAISEDAAKDELRRCSGTQFDPDVVEAFLRVLRSDEELKAA